MTCDNCKKRWFGIMVELCEECEAEESYLSMLNEIDKQERGR